MEDALQSQLVGQKANAIAGVCWVCAKVQNFYFDRKYSGGIRVNWRERLVCKGCGLNNRLRMSMQISEQMAANEKSSNLTEHVTPL